MSRIAVIGAGITGAFTSYMLAKHGYDVMVFDGKGMSCDATACNPGGINPLHGPGYPHVMASFYLHAYHEHLEHRDEIQKLSGIDYDLRVIDRIFLAFDEEEKKGLKKIEADYNRLEGFKAQWMSRDELKEIEPRISSKAVGGLFTTGNMSVDAQQYRTALCRAAEKLGAKFIDQDVLEIQCDHEQATHVRTEEMMYEVESLFLCSGYKTGEFLDALGLSLPVSPVKGEMLHVRFDTPFPCDITHGLTGLYHHRDNEYWLGGTRNDNDASEPSEEGKHIILKNIAEVFPELSGVEILHHCAGARPTTSDGLPIIGEVPGYTNIYVGSGSGSKGILLCAGIALELLNYVEKKGSIYHDSLSPWRFYS